MKTRKLTLGAVALFGAGLAVGIYLSQDLGDEPSLSLVPSAEAAGGNLASDAQLRRTQGRFFKPGCGTFRDYSQRDEGGKEDQENGQAYEQRFFQLRSPPISGL